MPSISGISDADRIVRRQDLLSAPIGDELTLMDTGSGQYFGMNTMATRIWTLLETPKDLASLCRTLTDIFDIDPDTCRERVAAFVADMAKQGLVSIDRDGGG